MSSSTSAPAAKPPSQSTYAAPASASARATAGSRMRVSPSPNPIVRVTWPRGHVIARQRGPGSPQAGPCAERSEERVPGSWAVGRPPLDIDEVVGVLTDVEEDVTDGDLAGRAGLPQPLDGSSVELGPGLTSSSMLGEDDRGTQAEPPAQTRGLRMGPVRILGALGQGHHQLGIPRP